MRLCRDLRGVSLQITPRVSTDALAGNNPDGIFLLAGGGGSKRVKDFEVSVGCRFENIFDAELEQPGHLESQR